MSKLLRPAIAMIELIFALVIMGIVLMSAPQLVSLAQQSGYVSTQQEAIASVASHMSMILSRHWDNANVPQVRPVTILRTTGDAAIGLGPNSIPMAVPLVNPVGARAGTPTGSWYPRTFLPTGGGVVVPLVAGAILSEAGEIQANDIDDYHNTAATLMLAQAGAVAGNDNYIDQNFVMTTMVNYVVDTPLIGNYTGAAIALTYNHNIPPTATPGATSSVKWVNIVLNPAAGTVAELNKQITLNAFSCNIGGFELATEQLP